MMKRFTILLIRTSSDSYVQSSSESLTNGLLSVALLSTVLIENHPLK